MTPALVLTLALSLMPQSSANADCGGTFDRTEECESPDSTLPTVATDEKGKDIQEEMAPSDAYAPVRTFFLGAGGALLGTAVFSTIGWVSSAARLNDLLESGLYREDLHKGLLDNLQTLGVATAFFWGAATLTTAAGVSLWIFSPVDGSVRLSKKDGHE